MNMLILHTSRIQPLYRQLLYHRPFIGVPPCRRWRPGRRASTAGMSTIVPGDSQHGELVVVDICVVISIGSRVVKGQPCSRVRERRTIRCVTRYRV